MRDKPKLLERLQQVEKDLTKFIDEVNAYTAGMTDQEFFSAHGLRELDRAMADAVALRAEIRRIHYIMD